MDLPYKFHALDLRRLDPWSSAHRRLAPQGEVPVLIDGTTVMADATIALVYLAESHPCAGLMPADAVARYQVQASNDVLDAALLEAVNLVGWHRQQDAGARAEYDAALAAIPGRQKAAGWSAVWRDAEADRLQQAGDKIVAGLARMDTMLGSRPWLIGEAATLADINAFALVEGLPALLPAVINEESSPRLTGWMQRMRARPAVRRALTGSARGHSGTTYAPPR
jgi:glutathione S-transferase